MANSVRFLTGHSRKGGADPLFVAENAADIDSTLVVYMGLSTFSSISLKLIHHGLPSNTPAVAVERGTTLQQRTVSTILHITLSFSSSLAMFIFCQALWLNAWKSTFSEALLFKVVVWLDKLWNKPFFFLQHELITSMVYLIWTYIHVGIV